MGNRPDKIAWSEKEFNAHNKYLYDLEDDPEYQEYQIPYKEYTGRTMSLNWMYAMKENLKIPFTSMILAIYIMDAYCSIIKTVPLDLSGIKAACLFLAHNSINIDSLDIDAITTESYAATFDMGSIMEKLGGRIIRPIPSFFIYNVTELQNKLIYIALTIKGVPLHKASIIAKTVKYMTSDSFEGESDEDMKAICYALSNKILQLKSDNDKLPVAMQGLADEILSDENFKKKCVDFVETNVDVRKNIKLEKLLVFRTPYKKMGVLGAGIAGDVHKIVKRGKEMAVKFQKEHYSEEVAVLELLSKSNSIIKLEGFLPEDADGAFLFFEIGSYDLKSAVVKYTYPDKSGYQLLGYFKQILEGLKVCEYYDVIHSDIKPDNIVWFEKERRYKLIDFGLAIGVASQRDKLYVEVCTVDYRPPEVFLTNGDYDYKIDIWSAGCVLYYMVMGRVFNNVQSGDVRQDSIKNIFKRQGTPTEESWPGVTQLPNYKNYTGEIYPKNPYFLNEIPDDKNMCYAVIKSCLTMNPKNRPNAEMLLGCLEEY